MEYYYYTLALYTGCMAEVPSVEELLLRLPSHLIDKACSEEHLVKLTDHFSEWINIATYLGLTPEQKKHIEFNWSHHARRQRTEMFTKWKENEKENATYRYLVKAFHKDNQANAICELADAIKQEVEAQPASNHSQSSVKQSRSADVSALSAIPTLQRLSELHELSSKWYILGEELKVREEQLEMIYELCESEEHTCLVKMFGVWLRECNPSYGKLIKALLSIEESNVATLLCQEQGVSLDDIITSKTFENIKNEVESNVQAQKEQTTASVQCLSGHNPPSVPIPPPPPPECVVKYAKYLKTQHKRKSALPTPKWPPTVKEAVKLAIIEKEMDTEEKQESMAWDYVHGKIDNIVAKKKEIELVDAFKAETSGVANTGSIPLKILMDGAPGVGKTTLTRKACIDWANGEILQQYHLVILVPLREAKYQKAKSIEDLLPGDNSKTKQQVIEHLKDTSGKNVLFIFDGFDELSAEERRQESLFLDFIRGDCMSECTLLLTSRPYASDCLLHFECINRHVEVLGFTVKQISSCIIQNIDDEEKATELISKLHERLDIASLCYVPLNCAIIIYVYQQNGYTLPSTLTDLFNDFTFHCLKRHVTVVLKDEHLERQLIKPNKQLPKKLKEQLSALSELAYKGLIEDKLVFDYSDLLDVFPEHLVSGNYSVESCCLGLISSTLNTSSCYSDVIHYQFLHLSIQEFLAAMYIFNTLTGEEKLTFFLSHMQNERFRLMLLFLAGLTKLSIPSCQKLFDNEKFKLISRRFLYLAHLIYESQSRDLYKALLQCLDDKERFCSIISELTLFDCILIGNFLCSVDHSWKTLNLNGCSLNSHSIEVFNRVQMSLQPDEMCTFKTIFLNGNQEDLLDCLPLLLWVSHTIELHCADALPHAESIVPQYQDDIITTSQLYKKLLESSSKLKVLDLHGSFVTDSIANGIAAGLINNVSLERIDLGENALSFDTIKNILVSLNSCSAPIACLTMCGLQLLCDQCSIWKIISVAEKNVPNYCIELCLSTLKTLSINQADILCHNVFQSLTKNSGLEVLRLSGFNLTEISDWLSIFTQLKILDLNDSIVSDTVMMQIATALTNSKCIEKLYVDVDNNKATHSDTTLTSVFLSAYSSSNLHLLQICGIQLLREDIHKQAWKVKVIQENRLPQILSVIGNSSVNAVQLPQKLQVDMNEVTCRRAVTMFELLESNTGVEELSLSRSWEDSTCEVVGYGIKRVLELNTTIKKLDLRNCSAGDIMVQSIAYSLATNTSLEEIRLGSPTSLSFGVITAFLSAVSSNKSLFIVSLYSSYISREQPHSMWKMDSSFSDYPQFMVQFLLALEKSSLSKNVHMPHTLTFNTVPSTGLTSSSAVSIFRLIEHTTGVMELDLSGINLFTEDSTVNEAFECAIKRMLGASTTLRKLDLSSTNLAPNSVVTVFKSVKHNSCLENLHLSWNHHSTNSDYEAIGCAIKDMLKVNTALKELHLHDGNTLSDSIITDILSLVNSSESLCRVYVCNTLISREHPHCSCWWKVESHGKLMPQFLRALVKSSMSKVIHLPQSLNVKLASLTTAVSFLQLLECNTDVMKLDLSFSHIHDHKAIQFGCALKRMLKFNTTLQALSLQGCPDGETIVKAFAEGLTNNGSLKSIHLLNFNVVAAQSILSVAVSHPSLCDIYVSDAQLSREQPQDTCIWNIKFKWIGHCVPQLLLCTLTESSVLHTLNMSNTRLTSSIVVRIFQLIEHNTGLVELDLSWNNLRTIGTTNNEAFNGAMKRMLEARSMKGDCPSSLKTLNLNDTNLCVSSVVTIFQSLESNTCLKTLNLSWNQLQVRSRNEEVVGCAIKKMLEVNTTLEVFVNLNNTLSDKTLTALLSSANSHPTLNQIYVCGINILRYPASSGIWEIKSNHYETVTATSGRLHFSPIGMKIQPQLLWALTQSLMCNNVKLPCTLDMSNTGLTSNSVVSIFQLLEHNTGVMELNLSGNNLRVYTDDYSVTEAFEFNGAMRQMLEGKLLKTLNLSNTSLDSTTMVTIFQSLENDTCLKTLDLSWNQQFGGENNEEIGDAIKKMLEVNTTLEILDLQGCVDSNVMMQAIAEGLTKNASLKIINLINNNLSDKTVVTAVLSSANSHPTLCNVCVCGAQISKPNPQGCWNVVWISGPSMSYQFTDPQLFLHALGESSMSSTLHTLNLSNAGLTSSSAVCIIQLIEHNTGLIELNLSGNDLFAEDHTVIEAFNGAIKQILQAKSTSLQTLNMSDTDLDSTTMVTIFQSLENNICLKTLDLSWNQQLAMEDENNMAIAYAIKKMLKVNKTLEILSLLGCSQVIRDAASHP